MAEWYKDDGFQSDIVLSTRIRLARNLKDIPFPSKMNSEDASKVIELTENALKDSDINFVKTELNSLNPTEKEILVEKHYISPNIAKQKKPCAVFTSEDKNISIMVNEEDHLRIQAIFAGLECQKAYDLISKADAYLADKLSYAVHPKYGYLTSCLTNAGTGMRVSVMLHLPAICRCSVAEGMFAALGKLGITVRGMYGEGSKASGYLFQISNQMTLGVDETEILAKLYDAVNQVISKEKELRASMLKQQGPVLEDKIMRSMGILKSARVLSSGEMLSLLSYARFGMSQGLITDTDAKTLNTLMTITSPAHLSKGSTTVMERDVERASIVRRTLNEK